MISRVSGTLTAKDLERVEVQTAGGVSYEIAIPLTAYEGLPRVGDSVVLHTHLVVREDDWLLYGFAQPADRRVFRRLLAATGVGPSLALGMLSTLSAERLVRAIREHDIATLQTVPRVGRKKAEQLVLDLADKLDDVFGGTGGDGAGGGAVSEDAIRALVSLGYANTDAERAVKSALDARGRGTGTPELVRTALATLSGR